MSRKQTPETVTQDTRDLVSALHLSFRLAGSPQDWFNRLVALRRRAASGEDVEAELRAMIAVFEAQARSKPNGIV